MASLPPAGSAPGAWPPPCSSSSRRSNSSSLIASLLAGASFAPSSIATNAASISSPGAASVLAVAGGATTETDVAGCAESASGERVCNCRISSGGAGCTSFSSRSACIIASRASSTFNRLSMCDGCSSQRRLRASLSRSSAWWHSSTIGRTARKPAPPLTVWKARNTEFSVSASCGSASSAINWSPSVSSSSPASTRKASSTSLSIAALIGP